MSSATQHPSLPATESLERRGADSIPQRYALLGNPNTGKTTLFNRLCGLRSRTANFPGCTVEAHIGSVVADDDDDARIQIVDLPGIYSLHLDRPESTLSRQYLAGEASLGGKPHAVLIVADATNLSRNLAFVNQALQQGLPAVIALNMIDLAQKRGLTIDVKQLGEYLGVPVVALCARSGEGIDDLLRVMRRAAPTTAALPDVNDAPAVARWAEGVAVQSAGGAHAVGVGPDTFTDRLDAAFTHPVLGLVVFAAIMTGLFYTIFALASVPMDLIEWLFASLGGAIHSGFAWMRDSAGIDLVDGPIHDLLIDGVVAGIAGTVVFLPQICLLFFLITLLEDTGYLARASFVMDRVMRRFGLPGQAFVPMLSAHACAIPAIMSTRLIPDHRDRIAAIFVTPFLSCSARLPVYVLLIGVLFADSPVWAGLAFTGCYLLGASAAMLTALIMRRTILRGPNRPMVLELPTYKMPSLRNALLATYDRAMMFLRKAGTVIVAICLVLWWLSAYPKGDLAIWRSGDLAIVQESTEEGGVEDAHIATSPDHQIARSFIGRIGQAVEPVFAPLGFDWQLSIGVLTSFAAREVFVSTMSVLVADSDDAEDPEVLERITHATRSDGSPLFTKATAASLLVFYVLAMQCLPTLAVTRRETGSWKWALLQLGYMSLVAYAAALLVRTTLTWAGVA